MPIYEYLCNTCKESFSLLQKIGSTEKDTTCPKCGSKEVKKKLSLFSCACTIDSGPSTSGIPSGFTGGGWRPSTCWTVVQPKKQKDRGSVVLSDNDWIHIPFVEWGGSEN